MKEIKYFRSFDCYNFEEEKDCINHEKELYEQCAELVFSICETHKESCNGCPIRTQCSNYSWCPETWEFD